MKLRSIITFCIVGVLIGVMILMISISAKLVTKKGAAQINFSTNGIIGNTPIQLGYARTPVEWKKGLSGQVQMKKNEGLLFLFKKQDYYGIWMKDMLFPIDVMWLNESGHVVYIKENFLPSSYPETITPNILSTSVLEVTSGFVKSNKIGVGDALIFTQNIP